MQDHLHIASLFSLHSKVIYLTVTHLAKHVIWSLCDS